MNIPELSTFMNWNNEQVADIAPETVLFAPAGTRRRAALDGIPRSEYSSWAIRELGESVALLFKNGARNIITPLLGPRQLSDPQEEYRNQVIKWISEQSTSEELKTLSELHRYNLRLIGPATRYNNTLKQASIKLKERSYNTNNPTLWMYVVQNDEEPWEEAFETAISHNTKIRSDIARILYGEDIKPVSLYIGFGRLTFHPNLIPITLFSQDIQCYWTTKAGFRISHNSLRKILYDSIFSRARNNEERITRNYYAQELEYHWNKEVIIGLGWSEHGFWIPKTNMED